MGAARRTPAGWCVAKLENAAMEMGEMGAKEENHLLLHEESPWHSLGEALEQARVKAGRDVNSEDDCAEDNPLKKYLELAHMEEAVEIPRNKDGKVMRDGVAPAEGCAGDDNMHARCGGKLCIPCTFVQKKGREFMVAVTLASTRKLLFFFHITQAVLIVALALINSSPGIKMTTTEEIFGWLSSIVLLFFVGLNVFIVGYTIARWRSSETWSFYLINCLAFAVMYRFLYILDNKGLQLPPRWISNHHFPRRLQRGLSAGRTNETVVYHEATWFERNSLMVYFSVTTQTSVGFGDAYPTKTAFRILAMLQMFVGLTYGSILVGLTLEDSLFLLLRHRRNLAMKHLERLLRKKREIRERERDRACCWFGQICGSCKATFRSMVRYAPVAKSRRCLRRFLLTFNVAITLIMDIYTAVNAIERGTDIQQNGGALSNASLYLMMAAHLVLVLIILVVSMKYVRRADIVTIEFLITSFISTAIVFGSWFFVLNAFDVDAFNSVRELEEIDNRNSGTAISVAYLSSAMKFQTFSITTLTTTGYGFVSPHSNKAMWSVIFEMLISQLFAQILLGTGLNAVATQWQIKKSKKYRGIIEKNKDEDIRETQVTTSSSRDRLTTEDEIKLVASRVTELDAAIHKRQEEM